MKRVLVVDDSPTMRRMVISSIRNLSPLKIDQAESGLDAIEKLTLFGTDLVILDLNMPDMHGMEVIRFIRQHESYRNIPIVILTTRNDEDTRTTALKAGADMYITKPYDPATFSDKINKLLNS
jgi:two-component system chemotaxis response regulator CheY